MKFLKLFYLPLICLSFSLFFVKPAFAADPSDISKVDCSVYAENARLFDAAVNQQRFAQDMVTSLVTGPMMSTLTGVNFEKVCQCSKDSNGADPSETPSCEEIKPFIASGGLFITTKFAMDITENSKDFVNIKYYAQDILKNVPFTKTAFAAEDPSPLPMIFEVWKEMRNLSYILFTAVFITLGFMVMFRKRIDPQTVVTVQNALPRVIIALVLITFSYPIVSLIFQLSGPLASLVQNTLANTMGGGQWANLGVRLLGFIVGLVFILVNPLSTALGIAFVVLVGLIIAALILALIVYAVTFVTRLGRVALLTVLAPFIFVMGALPGNEKTLLNWFKSLLSVTLQIPALTFILWFGLIIGSSLGGSSGNFAISALSLVLNPLIGVFILFQAGKVPKMVDNALGVEPLLFGDSGGKKKK